MEVVYVSGLWLLPENPKNDENHYTRVFPETIRMLKGKTLVFFYESTDVLALAQYYADRYRVNLKAFYRPLKKLPGSHNARDFEVLCESMELDSMPEPRSKAREKGSIHYWRDFKGGKGAYRDMVTIWMSKPDLIAEVVECFGSKSEYYAWVDASISRFNFRRKSWKFTKQAVQPDKLTHYANNMTYYGRQLRVNASFLCASSIVWARIRSEFKSKQTEALRAPYAHDEETLLSLVAEQKPHLFHCIGGAPTQSKACQISANVRYRLNNYYRVIISNVCQSRQERSDNDKE